MQTPYNIQQNQYRNGKKLNGMHVQKPRPKFNSTQMSSVTFKTHVVSYMGVN